MKKQAKQKMKRKKKAIEECVLLRNVKKKTLKRVGDFQIKRYL